MTRLFTLAAILLALLFPLEVFATPGSTPWLKKGTSDEATNVSAGRVVSIAFAAASANSKAIAINSKNAEVCFLPNENLAGGAARITLYKALTPTLSDTARITIPPISFDGLDCDIITNGIYWFEIDIQPAGAEIAIIVITGV